MTILGISAFYHDSAAAIIRDGKILAAAQEERFTRKKHDPAFPTNAVKYCLEYAGTTIDQLDAVVFYDKPLLKFERLLETYYGFSPKGVSSFITAIPVWLKEKMFLKKLIKDELKQIQSFNKRKLTLLFPEHHLSHAASAFYPSPYQKAAILTLDGVGEWATASISVGEGKNITMLKELQFPHSVGLLYSAFTYFLGFKVNSGEYKLMGLAPYGNPNSERVHRFKEIITTKLIKINDDGSIWLDQNYFNYAVGLRMVYDDKWEELFGFPRRTSESEFEQQHSDLGLAIQEVTEEIIIKLAKHAKEITGADYLCMAGGVALNCVANGKLQDEHIFKEIFIQPAAGDAGGALGAALTAYHTYFDQEREIESNDAMKGSYLGPEFSSLDVENINRKYGAKATHFSDFSALTKEVAGYISKGNAVGWMQGRMEFGPRALGRRSILGDARNPEMQKKLNLKIKYRESFRPFAPSVLAEDVTEFFDYDGISPYMLLVHKVHPNIQRDVPANYHELPIREKLYVQRSSLPAITHIDFSGRIQTVHKETNPEYWELIHEFKKITGVGVVVNTSFNVRGEPIVCTPDDAYRCFMRTEMDYLVIGNYVYKKEEQPSWEDKDDWKEEFLLD
ncbi:carbamoyltransferase family protein [Kordia zhangzhouensis]|uniref:carbamoyltransferase family protein n=1 Tax=Kordia zhangzhouensis TaxID=1620405 RepID=UPI0006293776|nr:carbamoyltransferase [Kordia zhangzhouensis]